MSAIGPDVTLIRHGETAWSLSGQHTGTSEIPLTEAGEEQAKQAGSMIDAASFDRVLVSPRQRARRTAELAGLTGYEIEDDLAEWDYGEFEGRTTPEIQETYTAWSIWHGPWVGGETAEQVSARADRLIGRIRALGPETAVACVAHGHFLRVFGARWVGLAVADGARLGLDTAAVCHLDWEHDYPIIHRWNVTCP